MSSENLKTVELRRSVRYGRLLIGGALLGGLVGSFVALVTPVAEGALYTVGQIAGFMLLVGGIVGLTLGALLALILTAVAKRQHGTGLVAEVHEEVESATEPADEAAAEQAAGPVAEPAAAPATNSTVAPTVAPPTAPPAASTTE